MNPRLVAEQSWEIPWRRAEIPAAGGHGNARSVALAQAAVSHGGSLRGVELLSSKTIDRIFDVQAAGRDLVIGIGVTFGVGYGLSSPRAPISPNARVCYWGGWGGSLVVNDVDAGFTMAYVMNRMGEGTVGDDRAHTLLRAIYASLG
jgi:CubicO group peptidase (beta-lactamase class C family)